MDPGKRGFIVVNIHPSLDQGLSKDMLPTKTPHISVVYLSWLDRRAELESFHQNVTLGPSEVIVLLDNDA